MTDYIRRDTAIKLMKKEAAEMSESFEELGGESGIYADAYEDAANMLQDMPAADVVEVVHGTPVTEVRTRTIVGYHEEIGVLAGDRSTLYRRNMVHADIPYDNCPICGATLCSRWHNFCGKCGAKMDGGFDDGKRCD